ncbi:carbohydrate ABC transporter substrate-binding protein, CUT1 family (TC 3.A.1.1.-) [Clostridium cavendishii DSM 21758]|uniref:Carbohydrate ABC transporter substrate-binding protein, CUT1 family (TC 3.A.1.1.-) n=1 Tax=Clostridium cavendishii DSM 21758 TaxID=1121302 RepID=A0A1M6DFR3_9CLOT|nr:carbohydrate ABC transporter substrate-binding protein [Clostridium cavendishii]SHI72022.1 carbohydrate ABC transporter substrate-binding protein, CUT1 family (TC 3.A.1.1.-) [Clostridium cavendishii DSM 21758]
MRKGKLAFILSAVMITSMFAGCSGDTKKDEAKDKGKTLKIAAFEGGYGKVYWEKLKENFEKTHKGVTVELTVSSNLEEKIRPQIQSGNIPDFVYLATNRKDALTETFIKEQSLQDLTEVLEKDVPGEKVKVKDKILPGFLKTSATNPYSDGKTYLAPLFYSPTGLFYNKTLFKEKGYELPKTWDQMFALGDKAKKDGTALLAYSTAGYFDTTLGSMLAASGGVDTFQGAMSYKEGFWKTSESKTVLDTIGKMKNYLEPTVVPNANSQGFKNNQQLVLDNKALFIPNGTWLPDEMKDAPRANGFEWGFMAYPSFKDGGDRYSYNFLEQMYIPKDAANKELAEDFMAYMYSDEAVAIIAENAKAVVPVKGSIDIAKKYLSPLQIEMLSVYDNGALPIMGNFVATTPVEGVNFNDIYTGTIDSVMTGNKTVADWQNALDDASNKLRVAIIKK